MDGAIDVGLRWLEGSGFGTAIRQSRWLYPVVETGHILGFVVLVGGAVMFDLRVLGISRSIPVEPLARLLLWCARVSLPVVLLTGLTLFITNATTTAANPVFRLKLVLIAAGLANAAAFRRGAPFRSVRDWDRDLPSPLGARLTAALSLLLWIGVIVCGRFIAYT
jgi:hypothetical protein